MNFTLYIPKISINVIIGCFNEERRFKKPIEIEITLKYRNLPESCFTDSLENKSCDISYKDLLESLKIFANQRSYFTIEKWCYETSNFLIKEFNLENLFSYCCLKFKKIIIPLDGIDNGVQFIYEKEFL